MTVCRYTRKSVTLKTSTYMIEKYTKTYKKPIFIALISIYIVIFILSLLTNKAEAMTVSENGNNISVSTTDNIVFSYSKSDLSIFDDNFLSHGSSTTDMFTYNSISNFRGWWNMGLDSVLKLYGDNEYSYVVLKNGVVEHIYNHITSFSQIPNNWGETTATTTPPFVGVTEGDTLISFFLFVLIILQIFGGVFNSLIGIKIKKPYYD